MNKNGGAHFSNSMSFYDYRDWSEWPEADVKEYAQELASFYNLAAEEAAYLTQRMLDEAGHYPLPGWKKVGPKKSSAEQEELSRALGESDADRFEQNVRINRPMKIDGLAVEEPSYTTVGNGLTKRLTRRGGFSKQLSTEFNKRQRRNARHPFSSLNPEIRNLSNKALWQANCIPVSSVDWLVRPIDRKPREGVWWYVKQLEHAYYNAREQAKLGNFEGAMWHAFRAGELKSELEIRLAHGELYEKYEAVRSAQREAGKTSATATNEEKQAAYRRQRAANRAISNTEAARRAARELGYKGPTAIVRAFPDGLPD